ncbi:hypothetical protein ACD578_27495 (plasmid) [Microvirga sp. RSM25]|uniref:hypothetical protein n=1 Tax=Microvirga sp. RSM25 TaxID=3273802 RepID=UPI00384B8B4C
MIYGHNETDEALDQKRQEVNERLARETRIGWPILIATVALIIVGAVIVAYLFLNTGGNRWQHPFTGELASTLSEEWRIKTEA